MHYKVYINNKSFVLTDVLDNSDKTYHYDSIHLDEIMQKLKYGSKREISVFHPNLEIAWKDFQKHFDVIEAAGGVVENDQSQYLLIYRNGRWDLPKGKMEDGETPEETAIREVKEECGILNIEIDRFLLDTFHIFTENNKKRLKITHWFKMHENNKSPLIPQTEEGIEKVEWIDINRNDTHLSNSYENIKLIFEDLRSKSFQ